MSERMKGRENIVRRVIRAFLYQPIARIHGSGVPKFPWTLTPPLQRLFRAYLNLRYRLMPWRWSAAVRAATDGIPLVRPLWFDFPDEPDLRPVDDELLVGDGLLAAPVVRDGWCDRTVRPPSGIWYLYWTGKRFAGGRNHLVDAPADDLQGLPLFVRAGTLLACGPAATSCENEPPDELWLDPYPGRAAEGELRSAPETGPDLAWRFDHEELSLVCGPRPLRAHIAGGAAPRTIDLKSGDRAAIPLDTERDSFTTAPLVHS